MFFIFGRGHYQSRICCTSEAQPTFAPRSFTYLFQWILFTRRSKHPDSPSWWRRKQRFFLVFVFGALVTVHIIASKRILNRFKSICSCICTSSCPCISKVVVANVKITNRAGSARCFSEVKLEFDEEHAALTLQHRDEAAQDREKQLVTLRLVREQAN